MYFFEQTENQQNLLNIPNAFLQRKKENYLKVPVFNVMCKSVHHNQVIRNEQPHVHIT